MCRLPVPARLALLVLAALVAAACGTPPVSTPASPSAAASAPADLDVFPVVVSSELAVGDNRFLFSFLDLSNRPIAAPDRPASVAFTPPGGSEPTGEVEGEFVWGIEGERGIYAAPARFPVAGSWTATFRTLDGSGRPVEIPFSFDVREDASAVRVGEPAPSVETPTAADVNGDLSRLSTDPDPDPRFYETSVADALAAGEPFVLAFATPAFCQTAQCGPTLDRVKAVAAAFPDMTFINVEPYVLAPTDEGRLQPVLSDAGQLQPVEAVTAYGILTEPWIYVVDADGTVRASFEAIVADDELAAAIQAVTG